MENDHTEQLASDVFDQISAFADGFNKSHAAAYMVSYQTASEGELSEEFITASMALDTGSTDKLAVFRRNARARASKCARLTLIILRPALRWGSTKRRHGNSVITWCDQNVGAEAMSLVSNARKWRLADPDGNGFRARPATVARWNILCRQGPLDSTRTPWLQNMDTMLGFADASWRDAQSSQDSLFGGSDALDSSIG